MLSQEYGINGFAIFLSETRELQADERFICAYIGLVHI